MKTVCLILAIILGDDGQVSYGTFEKRLSSPEECELWKHQQEFMPPVRPIIMQQFHCLSFWEA